MKKLVVLLVLSFGLAISVSAQRNTFYYGDKNAVEIDNSIALFNDLIDDYEESIVSLQKDNEKMVADFRKNGNSQSAKLYANRVAVNDSLITLYRSKVLELKETKQTFLEMTAGDSQRRVVSSRGNNPAKLAAAAEAYSVMSYTDAYVRGGVSSFQNEGVADSGLKGLIVNKYYQDLVVTVRGPGGSMSQFNVPANGGRASFSPRMPGSYSFSFSNGRETKTVIKDLRPGFSEFYDEDGSRYDLMAIMPRGY